MKMFPIGFAWICFGVECFMLQNGRVLTCLASHTDIFLFI